MSQKLPVFNFEWVEDTSHFNEYFVKNYDSKCEVGYIPKVDVNIPKNYTNPTKTYHFYQKERNLETSKSLLLV